MFIVLECIFKFEFIFLIYIVLLIRMSIWFDLYTSFESVISDLFWNRRDTWFKRKYEY